MDLPQLVRNVKVLKELKIINFVINPYGSELVPNPYASQEDRAVALDELPMSIKASVKELIHHDQDDVQILIEKEANEEPRLM